MKMSTVDLYAAGIMSRILNPERYNIYQKIYQRKLKLKKEKDPAKIEKLKKEIEELTALRNSIPNKTPTSLGFKNM